MKRSNVLALVVGAFLLGAGARAQAPSPTDTPPADKGPPPGHPAPPRDVWAGDSSEPEVGQSGPPPRFTDDEAHSPVRDLLVAGFCCLSPVLGVGGLAYFTYRMTRKKRGDAPGE